MVLLELFWSFLKIGFTSFGGLSMIPLIMSEMEGHGFMTAKEVTDIVAIAEMTPGPLALNCATFAGIRTVGVLGAMVSNLGILGPTFTICFVASMFFEKFKNGKRLKQMMTGVRPMCLGLILGVIINLAETNYFPDQVFSLTAAAIGALDLFLLMKCKVSIPKVLLLSGILGVVFIR